MTNPRFDEPELYLLKNWSNAHLLEESMHKVREKYDQIFNEVLTKVQENYRELDLSGPLHAKDEEGYVGIGKKTWPSMYGSWPSALRLENIRLEHLVSEDHEAPAAGVVVWPPKEVNVNFEEAKRKLSEVAEQGFGKKEFAWLPAENTKRWAWIGYSLPEPRQELLELLLRDEARGFIGRMVEHFDTLAKFIPVVDEIFQSGQQKRR